MRGRLLSERDGVVIKEGGTTAKGRPLQRMRCCDSE